MPPKSAKKKNRNKANNGSQSRSPTVYKVILVTTLEVREGDTAVNVEASAKDALKNVLQSEVLHSSEVRGENFIGNQCGHDAATQLRSLKQKVTELHGSLASLKNQKQTLESEKRALEDEKRVLEDENRKLETSHSSYMKIRHRFISTYKRDKLSNKPTKRDQVFINQGNSSAHGGDVAHDAGLYEGHNKRTDSDIFMRLYGVKPRIAMELGLQMTLDVLNKHAKVISSDRGTGSDEFYTRFAKFIACLKESGYTEGGMDLVAAGQAVLSLPDFALWKH